MAKSKEEKELEMDEVFTIDELPVKKEPKGLVSCLRNERVAVKLVPRGRITNPKHVLYGGLAEGASFTLTVPRLSSGMFVNVLTDKEKAYLEAVMELEDNALSVYKKTNNFWDDGNDMGISKVRLTKSDNFLDLSNPEDYIRYKILLANKDVVAPSISALQDSPKASYRFVIVSLEDESRVERQNMSNTMRCYKEFGKIEDNKDILRVIIETLEGKPTSSNVKLEFLLTKANQFIQADSKLFLKVITDEMLPVKVLIKKAFEEGHIVRRNDLYYLSDGTPLCEDNEESTLSIAAKYLNNPKHQGVKFSLEAKLK